MYFVRCRITTRKPGCLALLFRLCSLLGSLPVHHCVWLLRCLAFALPDGMGSILRGREGAEGRLASGHFYTAGLFLVPRCMGFGVHSIRDTGQGTAGERRGCMRFSVFFLSLSLFLFHSPFFQGAQLGGGTIGEVNTVCLQDRKTGTRKRGVAGRGRGSGWLRRRVTKKRQLPYKIGTNGMAQDGMVWDRTQHDKGTAGMGREGVQNKNEELFVVGEPSWRESEKGGGGGYLSFSFLVLFRSLFWLGATGAWRGGLYFSFLFFALLVSPFQYTSIFQPSRRGCPSADRSMEEAIVCSRIITATRSSCLAVRGLAAQ